VTRERLPERTLSENFKFHHEGVRYHGTFSHFDDGRLGAVFLNGGRAGSGIAVMSREVSTILSLALQYGCPRDVLFGALQKLDVMDPATGSFQAGPVGRALEIIT
jgi:hypothetical protein